jgi:hypothetical protein
MRLWQLKMLCRSLKEAIDSLNEELIMLCEIRGELSDEDNARIENRIFEIQNKLKVL